MPKVRKNIDGLENFVLKSLKNQLNDDNKKSQVLISKMKKSYEELQKKIEAVSLKYSDAREQFDELQERFDNADMERQTEFKELEDLLQDQEKNIYGDREATDSTLDSVTADQLGDESL